MAKCDTCPPPAALMPLPPGTRPSRTTLCPSTRNTLCGDERPKRWYTASGTISPLAIQSIQLLLKKCGTRFVYSAPLSCPHRPYSVGSVNTSSHPSGLGSGVNNSLKSAWPASSLLSPPLSAHPLLLPCLCPCSSGLYWVNKLAPYPTLLMRTRSHDRPLPTLKLSSLRNRCHYLPCTSQWNAFCSLQGRRTAATAHSLKSSFLCWWSLKNCFISKWCLFWVRIRESCDRRKFDWFLEANLSYWKAKTTKLFFWLWRHFNN